MPLTPQDVVRKEFREAFRGYNQADVDLFLDEVVEEFTRLSEENQKMKVRLAALQQEVARLREGRAPAVPVAQTRPAGTSPPAAPDPARVDSEVRARLRRYFEERLRELDEGSPVTATVQRIARELPTSTPPEPPRQEPRQEPRDDEPPRRQSGAEPFWAGE